jgi:hypothetical protein
LFECTTDDIEARSRACPGEAEDKVATLADEVLSMTSTIKFFHFLASGSATRREMRASSDDTAGEIRIGGGARRSAPETVVSSLALLPGCSCVCI